MLLALWAQQRHFESDRRPCTLNGHSFAFQPRHTVFRKVICQFFKDAGCSGGSASRNIKQMIGLKIDDFQAFLVRKATICNQ